MSKTRITAEQRRSVTKRANNCCEYCRFPGSYSGTSLSMDHIQPEHVGGETTLDNLALACQNCNSHKHTKLAATDSSTGQSALLYNPRREQWSDHFAWSKDFTLVEGLTPTGRATIEALQLNRPGLINIRAALRAVGAHPPEDLGKELSR
ncbi:MAG: HNH endonuclease [Chloroflexota bacterium]|nr:HNH endonuclease [Chloroflexota bacterium]